MNLKTKEDFERHFDELLQDENLETQVRRALENPTQRALVLERSVRMANDEGLQRSIQQALSGQTTKVSSREDLMRIINAPG